MLKQTDLDSLVYAPISVGTPEHIFNRMMGRSIKHLYIQEGEEKWKRGDRVEKPKDKGMWDSKFPKNSLG